jgi:amidophosphoribosyltransferase
MTAFNVQADEIKEVTPGHALIIKKNGDVYEKQVRTPKPKKSCSFERIYFSRGNDVDIYQERKNLGRQLTPTVLKSIDYDMKNSVFSFIPNTAEVAFYGMVEGLHHYLNGVKRHQILTMKNVADPELSQILEMQPRVEKIALKDAKLRTFITNDNKRDDMVAHVYDTTYGVVKPGDNLVVLDDSIVRGTTLKQSIIKILDRLQPKKIVIVSSAPQIRYPDCYGIDMARMGDFIAFQAAIELIRENNMDDLLDEVYEKAKEQEGRPADKIVNAVKEIYQPFTAEDISKKISQLLTPAGTNAEVEIIYQSIEGLHSAVPGHTGDWYFTGNYPTWGGNKVVNRAFMYYMEGKTVRAY